MIYMCADGALFYWLADAETYSEQMGYSIDAIQRIAPVEGEFKNLDKAVTLATGHVITSVMVMKKMHQLCTLSDLIEGM